MDKNPRKKKTWEKPCLTIYGDMAVLTKGGCGPGCKAKVLGLGDDFASNISTVGGP
jgi:hypothetical protein